MTFTYLPSTASNRDKVRFLIGDTDTVNANKQIFTDEELDMFSSGDLNLWAGNAMLAIASSRARISTVISLGGDFSVSRSQVAAECRAQAEMFFERSATEPYATEVALEDEGVTAIDAMDDAGYNYEPSDTELNTP